MNQIHKFQVGDIRTDDAKELIDTVRAIRGAKEAKSAWCCKILPLEAIKRPTVSMHLVLVLVRNSIGLIFL